MQIGKVIRKYRKEKNMTQEELAYRLGVSAPAVNKWENGNSYPDITLLAPIARLLHISLDTLLAFREELAPNEIADIVSEADRRLKRESYGKVFDWAKSLIETYPNCYMLMWQLAVILDAQRLMQDVPDAVKYESYILDCYKTALKSSDEKLKALAADSLFGYYLRNEQYGMAEECLEYFSEQNPERKRKLAVIYSKTGRIADAYRVYEELLFSGYQMLSMTFHGLYLLAMQDYNMPKAHLMTDKQQELAKLFEMGKYHEVSCKLELETFEKDADAVLETMEAILESINEITGFRNSSLYEHMDFKPVNPDVTKELKQNLIKCFGDKESYGFLRDNPRWNEMSHLL